MSKENLIQFMNQVTDSEELQNRIGYELDTDALIALGAAHGCKFTAEDLTEYAELSDEELDSVAGGGINRKSSTERNSPSFQYDESAKRWGWRKCGEKMKTTYNFVNTEGGKR